MKNIGLIFRTNVFRSKLIIVLAAAAAVFMCFVYWSVIIPEDNGGITRISGDSVKLGVIDGDQSPLSADLKKYMTDSLGMELSEGGDYSFYADLLIDRNISAIIEIPKGFFESAAAGDAENLVITTLDDYENAAFVEVYLNTYMEGIGVYSAAARGSAEAFERLLSAEKNAYSVTEKSVSSDSDELSRIRSAFYVSSGFTMMMISAVTFFLSYLVLADRQLGTYRRMLCSAVKPVEYIVGTMLFGLLCCTAMNLIFTLYSFGITRDFGIPMPVYLLANELFVLFSVGFAILIAQLIRSNQTLLTVAVGYTTLGCMLGGAWFPIADGLGAIGNVSKLFPQYWFTDLVRSCCSEPDYNPLPNLCVLALFAVLVYLLSAVVFAKKSEQSSD